MYSFSLIIPTLGDRIYELKRLIESIKKQNKQIEFQLIFIEQGDNTLLLNYLNDLKTNKNITIMYKRIFKKGISLARNIGLKLVKNDYILFTDDDCWYKNNFFDELNDTLIKLNEPDMVLTNFMDPVKNIKYKPQINLMGIKKFSIKDIYKYTSINIVVKKSILIKNNDEIIFNEKLGAGSFFGAGEETDFIIKVFNKTKNVYVLNDLNVYHPIGNHNLNYEKIISYGRGFGALYSLYKKDIKAIKKEYYKILLKSLIAMIIYFFRDIKKSKYYFFRIRGMIQGNKQFKKSKKERK